MTFHAVFNGFYRYTCINGRHFDVTGISRGTLRCYKYIKVDITVLQVYQGGHYGVTGISRWTLRCYMYIKGDITVLHVYQGEHYGFTGISRWTLRCYMYIKGDITVLQVYQGAISLKSSPINITHRSDHVL